MYSSASVCSSYEPVGSRMNQPSCNLAVVVVSAWSWNVIVGDSVPVVSPSSLIRNRGSYGVASGIAVAIETRNP